MVFEEFGDVKRSADTSYEMDQGDHCHVVDSSLDYPSDSDRDFDSDSCDNNFEFTVSIIHNTLGYCCVYAYTYIFVHSNNLVHI